MGKVMSEPLEEFVRIPLTEYRSLLNDKELLDRLYANGLGNWEGYDL